MKKVLKLIVAVLLFTIAFSGCKTVDSPPIVVTVPPEIELVEGETYSNEIGVYDPDIKAESTEVYNKNLFYRNKLLPTGADTFVLYCDDATDTENYGKYFCWGTTGVGVYNCFASKDCVSWEKYYGSYVWPTGAWEASLCWAPEVVYDKDALPEDYGLEDDHMGQGVYFMTYTAGINATYSYYLDTTDNQPIIGMAVSTSPYGPYQMYNGVEKGAVIGGVNYAEAENFKQYTEYKDKDLAEVSYHGRRGGEVTNDDVWFNVAAFRAALSFQWENREFAGQTVDGTYIPESAKYMVVDEGAGGVRLLDSHCFVDPVSGDKYFYFARSGFGNQTIFDDDGVNLFAGNYIYVIKTLDNDWSQLDYSTATRLTRSFFAFTSEAAAVAYNEIASEFDPSLYKDGFKETKEYHQQKISIDLDNIAMNEGPVMTYNPDTGLYYLTVSSGSYPNNTYCVIQLVGYSPVGPFRKLDADEGGLVLGVDNGTVSDVITGVGHHSIVQVGDELLIVYHRHVALTDNIHNRHPATDRLRWVKNDLGMTVLYANGPTSNLQPLFYDNGSTDYDIISDEASVSVVAEVDGQKAYNDAKLLNDDIIVTLPNMLAPHVKEFEFTSDQAVITLTFDSYRDITAIMVYNSRDYYKSFLDVNRIEMDFIKDGVQGTAVIKNLEFDWNMNEQTIGERMRAGGSAVAVFNELKVNEIRITVNNVNAASGYSGITAISEIYVLGKPLNS